MKHLRKLGFGSIVFLFLGLVFGAWPRNAGMAPQSAAWIAVCCYAVGVILALVAFMQSQRSDNLDSRTQFLSRAPFALIALGVLLFFLRAMTGLW